MRQDDDEVVCALTEWLREDVKDKSERRARDQEEWAASRAKSLSTRLIENASGISSLVGILGLLAGGGWAVVTFLDQQQQRIVQQRLQLDTERRQAISKFAVEITDPARRNAAAYALATLGAVDALPLLSNHLVEATRAGDQSTFVKALSRALVMLGEPALSETAKINRLDRAQYGWLDDPLVRLTSEIIVDILRRRAPPSLDAFAPAMSDGPEGNGDPEGAIDNEALAGVALVAVNLPFDTIEGLSIPGGKILGGNFCGANLLALDIRNGTISEGTFNGSELQSARLDGSRIETDLLRVRAINVSARSADFSGSTLAFGIFDGATMQDAKLSATDSEGASFRHADLSGADLQGGNFASANFEGANLTGAKLIDLHQPNQAPQLPEHVRSQYLSAGAAAAGSGAFVRGAIFSHAIGLDEATRTYLCRWGAVDVPEGCDDIEQVKFEIAEARGGFSRGSCF